MLTPHVLPAYQMAEKRLYRLWQSFSQGFAGTLSIAKPSGCSPAYSCVLIRLNLLKIRQIAKLPRPLTLAFGRGSGLRSWSPICSLFARNTSFE